jgi:hypothetical protein
MRRFIAAIVVLGGALLVHNACFVRPAQQNLAMAESGTEASLLIPGQSEIVQCASTNEEKYHAEYRPKAPQTANRFDRGRMNEVYDGELPRKRTSSTAAELDPFTADEPIAIPAPVAGQEFAQLGSEDSLPTLPPLRENPGVTSDSRVIPPPFIPTQAPRKPTLVPIPAPRRNVNPDNSLRSELNGTPDFVPPRADNNWSPEAQAAARVTLVINAEHQIQIMSESRMPPALLQQIPAGTLVITAEDFNLTPPIQAGAGNQLTCTGRVQLRSQQFLAQCSKLSFKGVDLMLEGTAQSCVEIKKIVAGEVSEFQLSADKISFTLSLDKIQIGDAMTVTPSRPNRPDRTTDDVPRRSVPDLTPDDSEPSVRIAPTRKRRSADDLEAPKEKPAPEPETPVVPVEAKPDVESESKLETVPPVPASTETDSPDVPSVPKP